MNLCTCGPTTVAAGFCECGAVPELAPLVDPGATRPVDGFPRLIDATGLDGPAEFEGCPCGDPGDCGACS